MKIDPFEFIMIPLFFVMLFLMIIVAPTIVLYEQWSYNQFCEERGYDHFTFRNVEEGYVKCYNKVYINHILQGEVDYETYKYEITLLSTLSDKND